MTACIVIIGTNHFVKNGWKVSFLGGFVHLFAS